MGYHESWYHNQIMYCLDVETFVDSNGDGIGDFRGLTSRLDYLAGLGVTSLWLLPFFPTPNRDDGYDVTDFTTIDPRLGTLPDFVAFVVEARDRGIKVIMELVPNHTSIDHPWFRAASTDTTSPYHHYYVWRDDDPGDTSDQVVFPGYQTGIWTYVPEIKKWYLHFFYDFQADLNFANPAVREEFRRIMGLWLQLGVSGFRIDAAPFLIDVTGLEQSNRMEGRHDWLRELNDFAVSRIGNAILVGEVNVALSKLADYFGGGNELEALFNFPLSRDLFLGLALERSDPVAFGLSQLPTIPDSGAWVNFLRKHDELNLSQLPAVEQEMIYRAFGPKPEMKLYDRGIRRRLAPMLGNVDRIRAAYSLLFSLPGSPVIFYGDEIGMGDNLSLDQRLSVRTPMQWTGGRSAGFSTAKEADLVRPLANDPAFEHGTVNVAAQHSNSNSLLNWLAHLIRTRKECPEVGVRPGTVLKTGNEAVFGITYPTASGKLVLLTNLSGKKQQVTIRKQDFDFTQLALLLCPTDDLRPTASGRLTLPGYGYFWARSLSA